MGSYHGEHTGTYTYCATCLTNVVLLAVDVWSFFRSGLGIQVCDIVLLRHRRSVDALLCLNLSRLLDELARDLLTQARHGLIHRKRKFCAVIHAQDIDESFMLLRLQGNPFSTCRRQTLQLKGDVSSWSLVFMVFDAAPLHTLIELEERGPLCLPTDWAADSCCARAALCCLVSLLWRQSCAAFISSSTCVSLIVEGLGADSGFAEMAAATPNVLDAVGQDRPP